MKRDLIKELEITNSSKIGDTEKIKYGYCFYNFIVGTDRNGKLIWKENVGI